MKTIKETKTITQEIVHYEAIDGTIFTTADECQKYEQTAMCIIKTKYNTLVVGHTTEFDLCACGNSDSIVDIVVLKTKEDIDTVAKMIEHICSHGEDRMKKVILPVIQEAFDSKSPLFVGWSCEKDWLWPIGSVKSLTSKIQSFVNDTTIA